MSKKWLDKNEWLECDLYDEIDIWDTYLCDPESSVNEELKIFPEPSIQCGFGSVVIFDESGKDRFESVDIDFQEWCEEEIIMASNSSSSDEYKEKYREYIKHLCNI